MAASVSTAALSLSLSSLSLSSPSSSALRPSQLPSLPPPNTNPPLFALRSLSSPSPSPIESSKFRSYVASNPSFSEEDEEESPENIRRAYEELYGPAFSRLSIKKTADDDGLGSKRVARDRNAKDNIEEKVVQVRRVTKVVKGGKQLSFRAIVVVGDKQGRVGVGVGKAKEVIIAVQKAATDARRHLINVPMTKQKTFPHRADGKYGAAKVMLRPAAPGTGVIAGGSVRTVLEMAGVVNAMGKELGSKNPLNNARAVVEAISGMKQFRDVAEKRGIPMEVLWQ